MINLAKVDGQCEQFANSPGLSLMFGVMGRAIDGSWPCIVLGDDGKPDWTKSSVSEDGLIKSLPTLLADKSGTMAKWSQYAFAPKTASIDWDASGDPSFQTYKHQTEMVLAGNSPSVRTEARKHLNAGSVWIAKNKSGEWVVVGSSDDPIYMKSSGKGGKGGSDKKGVTLKGESEGMMFSPPVIPQALIEQLIVDVIDIND